MKIKGHYEATLRNERGRPDSRNKTFKTVVARHAVPLNYADNKLTGRKSESRMILISGEKMRSDCDI